mgnify:FL=1
MSKETISVKSNGIRNELKEIRKSINELTNALIEIHIAQTDTHEKNNFKRCTCDDSDELREHKNNETGKNS